MSKEGSRNKLRLMLPQKPPLKKRLHNKRALQLIELISSRLLIKVWQIDHPVPFQSLALSLDTTPQVVLVILDTPISLGRLRHTR